MEFKNSISIPSLNPNQQQKQQQQDDNEEEDPYITRIKNSGCFPQHEQLQDCYYDKKDWRLCINEMKEFKSCFKRYNSHQLNN